MAFGTPAYPTIRDGVTYSGAPFSPDPIARKISGVAGSFDFKSFLTRGDRENGALALNDTLADICGGADAIVTNATSLSLSDDGLVIGSDGLNRYVQFPDSWKCPEDETGWLMQIVFKHDAGHSYGNSKTISIAGWGYQLGAEMQTSIQFLTSASGVLQSFRGYTDGGNVEFPNTLALTDGKFHLLSVGAKIVGGQITRYFGVDRAIVTAPPAAFDGTVNQPVNAGAPGYVLGGLAGFSGAAVGTVRHARMWRESLVDNGADYDIVDLIHLSHTELTAAGRLA
ncbi:hypothetical protein [Stakelama tenebrarum]|uniref:Uncharacterized protein n=1 Tax=Stakelama tenebrarum TaxID=2711215 RepID=A0A6G6Y6B3_9SPHN|nr:hypothetical protein [Sphingosinithalassobacter tenebrarum]QIG80123.1 hypothetical protein G5C33_10245 [Sphingosinithalassobacter tenebrarum]